MKETYEEIESSKPRFYMMDLNNYTDDFLRDIIYWQERKIKYLLGNWGEDANVINKSYLDKPKMISLDEARELVKKKIEKDKEDMPFERSYYPDKMQRDNNNLGVAREWWSKFLKDYLTSDPDKVLLEMRRKFYTDDGKPKCEICGKVYKNIVDSHTGEVSQYLWVPDCKHGNKDLILSIG